VQGIPCAVITIHPYRTEDPRQLTDRLRQQWLRVRTQNRHLRRVSHRPDPAHVEPSVPSTRNILRLRAFQGGSLQIHDSSRRTLQPTNRNSCTPLPYQWHSTRAEQSGPCLQPWCYELCHKEEPLTTNEYKPLRTVLTCSPFRLPPFQLPSA
jgi:hypothetical protein